MHDTIIIGAGPVGSHIAYRLAQLGYKVIAIDKKVAPGDDICCTGILSEECLRTFNIDNSLIIRQANSAKFFSPSGRSLRLWQDSPVAAIIDRPALDRNLAKQAEKAGADYLFGTKVTDIIAKPDGVKVTVSEQGRETTFKTKTAVIATGFGSTLTERLGLSKIKPFLFGAEAEVYTNGVDEVEIYFDQNLAPGGFAWLVPTKNGKGLAGLLTRYKADSCLKNFLSILSFQTKIVSTDAVPTYGVIPLRPLHKTYANRTLVVGEAAGQVKPTTGGGIYYGLLCADIAVNVLHQALLSDNLSATLLSRYQKQWRTKLGKELTIGYWAWCLYAKLSNDHIERLLSIITKNGIADFITTADNLSFDWHSRILLTLIKHLLPFH